MPLMQPQSGEAVARPDMRFAFINRVENQGFLMFAVQEACWSANGR